MATGKTDKNVAKAAKKPKRRLLNKYIGSGILRYSKREMYKRQALWRLKNVKYPPVKKEKNRNIKVKKIGGANNGGERIVFLKKPKANYPTKAVVKKRPAKHYFSSHVRRTRKNMKPGRVLILLAGRHQGKRVVLLKVLSSGLLLVTGPFSLNSCPLRRVSQRYVIGCQTRIDLGGYEVPAHINDTYFRRLKLKKEKKTGEGDIFAPKKEKYLPSKQRIDDQKEVDTAVVKAIKAHPESKLLKKYLQNMFSLRSSQYPHRMKF